MGKVKSLPLDLNNEKIKEEINANDEIDEVLDDGRSAGRLYGRQHRWSRSTTPVAALFPPRTTVSIATGFSKDKHACKGQNSCKGKGGCKAGDNGCKGKNSCKGKGGCATDGSKPPSQ